MSILIFAFAQFFIDIFAVSWYYQHVPYRKEVAYMGIGDKLNALLLENDSNPNKLSEETGISPSTIYSIIKRNNTKVDLSVLQTIADKFDVSLEYFADRGPNSSSKPIFFTSESEKSHIKKYRLIDQIGKEAVDAVLCTEYKRYEQSEAKRLAAKAAKEAQKSAYDSWQASRKRKYPENVVPIDFRRDDPADDYITIPVYDQGASAGTGVFLDSSDYEMVTMPEDRMTRKANFAVWVSGNSMEPKFSDGDLVLVRTQPTVEIGEIGIFILNGDGYIKKMGHNKLISINPAYDDIEIGEWDELYCKGKVLGKA